MKVNELLQSRLDRLAIIRRMCTVPSHVETTNPKNRPHTSVGKFADGDGRDDISMFKNNGDIIIY